MGKRSDFVRVDKDFYATFDRRAGQALAPHLDAEGIETYAELCVGDGALVRQLDDHGLLCAVAADVELRGEIARDGILTTQFGNLHCQHRDALHTCAKDVLGCDAIITNPPWSRDLLHPMIEHFAALKPTWLLFDADWAHTVQARHLMRLCSKIVSVGRLKWVAGSKHQAKDNCAWYRFDQKHQQSSAAFIPRADNSRTENLNATTPILETV